jgi:small subunit ribosomal protein S3Ae
MAQIKKRKTADTWKKKEWYTIFSSKNFEEREIGTTPATDPANMINRIIDAPLRDITGNMGHQFIKIKFRVTEVKGKNAHTEFDGFELVREYLRRNIRRRRSMVRVVRTVETNDHKKLQITVYAFTAIKSDTSKKDMIRKKMTDVMDKIAKENSFESVIQKMVFGTMASDIFREIRTITPIKKVELFKCELVREK